MIKKEIRSVVLNALQRYDKTAKAHPRVIDANCEAILNQMYNEVFLMSPLSLQRFTKEYGYSTPLAVSFEAATEIYYTTLPENIVYIPDRASGVRRIASARQLGIKFYPIDQREWDLIMGGSYVNYVKDKVGYVVTPTRVEYYGMQGSISTGGVRMDCLIPFSAYEDTDVVLYPEHVTQEGMGFIDRVVQRLIDKPLVDSIDNNAEIKA